MTFPDWLDAERGRLKSVADHFGVSPSAVSQWRTNGVPRNLMRDVRDLTGLPLDALLPPADGLPPASAQQSSKAAAA